MIGVRVAVMGGSIGGLTAGLLLRDLGCEVDVYERADGELDSRGAGIVVHPVTVRYPAERGGPDISALSTSVGVRRYLDAAGEVTHAYARQYRFTAYRTLYRALLDLFEGGTGRYQLGTPLDGVSVSDTVVTARHLRGDVEADLLVCADGVSSTTRGPVFDGVGPRYCGYVAWRGVVPEQELSGPAYARLVDALTYVLLPGTHILVYPIPALDGSVEPGRRLMNFVWYRNVAADQLADVMTGVDGARRPLSLPPGAVAPRHVDELRAAAERSLPAAVAEVVTRTEHPFLQVVLDGSVPRMVSGRACVIGDAAFTVRPHTAAATAKAAADGWQLADSLRRAGGDVPAALADWGPRQLEVGRRLLARAAEIGDAAQSGAGWRPDDPRLEFGLYGPGW